MSSSNQLAILALQVIPQDPLDALLLSDVLYFMPGRNNILTFG